MYGVSIDRQMQEQLAGFITRIPKPLCACIGSRMPTGW